MDAKRTQPAGSDAIRAGAMVANYRVERLLGRGGMGAVFLAYDTTLHRHVALKTIDVLTDSEASRAHLLREARNAAALNHPNICTVHEVRDAGTAAFIAMEYVDGRSLRECLDEGTLPRGDAIRLGIEAADALAYAHERNVVHRDFKAANAMLTAGGRLKIVDFGLSRRNDALAAAATTMASAAPAGGLAGTPYAMAPEQIRGEAADARTDVWALGVLLHEMVSGVRPFDAPTVPELFSAILRDESAPLPIAVPSALRAVIERCLQKDAVRRYAHAGEVKAALETLDVHAPAPSHAWTQKLTARRWLAAAVAIATIGAVVVGITSRRLRDRLVGGATVEPIKLAVLPFKNLTGDAGQEYFSDGLTDETITQLGRLHPSSLSVIARTSSARYKNRDTSIDQIGRELGVDYVLEGSARREGTRVRISARLVTVRDQTQRWADAFEREVAGVLALQNEVARGVAQSLALTLLPAEQRRLTAANAVDPDAHDAYLRGLAHTDKLTRADLDAAETYFNQALAKDPEYAPAYAGLSRVWAGRQQMQFVSPKQAGPELKKAAGKALALDGQLPEAHLALAIQYGWTDWNWAAADGEFRRAVELGPELADARAGYAHYLYMMKRPKDGRQQIQRAVDLDPLNELTRAFYARALGFEHRFADEERELRTVLATNPNSPMATNGLTDVLFLTGRYDESLAAERARLAAAQDVMLEDALERGYKTGGYREAMRQEADALATRSRATGVQSIAVGRLYVRAGARERALDWLERAYEVHDPNMPYLGVAEMWDGLRGEPRFVNLMRRLNLPM